MTSGRSVVDSRAGRRRRAGVTLLEVQVAFIVLGIALAGLGPLAVMYQRMATKLDAQMGYDEGGTHKGGTYQVPVSENWSAASDGTTGDYLIPPSANWAAATGWVTSHFQTQGIDAAKVPATLAWARRLGVSAIVPLPGSVPTSPGPGPDATRQNDVEILGPVAYGADLSSLTIQVSVKAHE